MKHTHSNAAAITPSLFLGNYLSIEHETFYSVETAVEHINNGRTVLVDSTTDALLILLQLGLSLEESLPKIQAATTVRSVDVPLGL